MRTSRGAQRCVQSKGVDVSWQSYDRVLRFLVRRRVMGAGPIPQPCCGERRRSAIGYFLRRAARSDFAIETSDLALFKLVI